ncbi:DUF1116 domain-containing protein [Mycolicibacterium sp.]|uniref:DUF1116 domain-containing protein n=1 Tax=Mycolicibacterium sp. TaxID=2320850 RepID=UPI003D13A51D
MGSKDAVRPNIADVLQELGDPRRKEANRRANAETIKRMKQSNPILVGIGKAKDVIPGMRKNLILHAGPPITWGRASGALKGAIIAGLIFEGMARDKEEAVRLMTAGEVDLEPCHDHCAVGPMAGIITHSMSVFIVEDQTSGGRTYSNLSDDLGNYLSDSIRFGVYEKPAIDHLHWMEQTLAPILGHAIETAEGVDFLPIIGRSLQMGDDCHVIMNAATPLFLQELMPGLIKACDSSETLTKIVNLFYADALFALNPVMATCKAISTAGSGVEHSSIVTVMARNGTEFGIKVSGLGDRWFTGLADIGRGSLVQGVFPSDLGRDMGDSAITETLGLGGTVRSLSGSITDATKITLRMYGITESESDVFRLPTLDGRGAPMGFDIVKIVKKNRRPEVNSGLAHKKMNRAAAGAGFTHPPMQAFVDALIAFGEVES